MSRAMFNSDQNDYMDSLARMPLESKCWCGWFAKGECHSCPPEKTCADKIALRCPECQEYPILHNSKLQHRRGCSKATL